MRKLLSLFLVLIMLTPAMLCEMPGVAKAEGHSHSEAAAAASGHHDKGHADTSKICLMQDCTGNDLQAVANVTVQKPGLDHGTTIMYAMLASATVVTAPPILAHTIRGPPLRPDPQPHTLPILHITQRLLI